MERIVRDAYTKYIARMASPPARCWTIGALIRSHNLWVMGNPVEGAIVLLPEDDHLLLDNVAVDPAAQGKGIGRALIEFAEAEARRRGYAEMRLYTHQMMTNISSIAAPAGGTGRGKQNGFARVFFTKRLSP